MSTSTAIGFRRLSTKLTIETGTIGDLSVRAEVTPDTDERNAYGVIVKVYDDADTMIAQSSLWSIEISAKDNGRRYLCSVAEDCAADALQSLIAAPMPITVNERMRLYNIPHQGGGYTCLGFDRCEKMIAAVSAWVGMAAPVGTIGEPARYLDYVAVMAAGAAKHQKTGARCTADLHPLFIGHEDRTARHYSEEEGRTRTYRVGVSMGWLPCHLEIRNGARGGGSVFVGEGDKITFTGPYRPRF